MEFIRLIVPGRPVPKPRMTQRDKWKKRPCVVRYREYADLVRSTAKEKGIDIPPAEHVIEYVVRAYFEPASSWPKYKRLEALGCRMRQKPDGSNILKTIEDVLWKDDEKLGDGRVERWWDDNERMELEIEYETPE